MPGEIEERCGLNVVEVVEDAGLVGAEDRLGGLVPYVPLVAGEIDLGIAAEYEVDIGAHGSRLR
jgi:hypothetical protein